MAAGRVEELDPAFDDHPSLAASLEDFEEQERRSPLFDLPSQHSGFRSDPEGSEVDDRSSAGAPWSPPGFKPRALNASSWYRHDPYLRQLHLFPSASPSRSRQTSPEYQDAEEGDQDLTIAANIPLPAGTDSPMKERSPEPDAVPDNIMRNLNSAVRPDENTNNYIRFKVHAEVQHREPFVPIFNFLRRKIDAMTNTKSSTILSVLVALFSIAMLRVILVPPSLPPVPDLIKLSTLAKSFEPLIFYSENGHSQITALQETSVAVWDLGESVRTANMTSAPLIVQGLDDLSENLRNLGAELTRFFADVDSDVDSILIVMDWAKRELSTVGSSTSTSLGGQIFDHVHSILNRGGLLETSSGPTPLGRMVKDIFGASSSQKTRDTLTRTFYEFLNVLEESINNELTHSAALFVLFSSIDRQFDNLNRVTVREEDTQDRLETDLLSSLWTRVMGPNAALLRKYEKNKQLLTNLRSRTVSNKHLIVEHHGRLQTLKVNLETLRRKLVSPLVRRNDSVSMGNGSSGGESVIDDQIRGLEGTHEYLKAVREKQKNKMMEMIYGAGSTKARLVGEGDRVGIESR